MNMQQTQGQPPGPQHNGSSSSSSNVNRGWQVEGADVPDRRFMLANILQLFKGRKHAGSEWQQKLPVLVKRLEEGLYRSAASREEYKDVTTLEERIQGLAQRISSHKAATVAARNMAPSSRTMTMIPTPGATMIPTPGLTASPGYAAGQFPPRNSVVTSAGGMRMVQNAQNATSNMVSSAAPVNQGCGHRHLNGRLDSPFIGAGQFTMNGNAMHSSSSYFGQGQIQRERFQIQKSEIQTSTMIPVPGLPSQVAQQLKTEANHTPQEASSQQRMQLDMSDKKKKLFFSMMQHASNCSSAEGQCRISPHCHSLRRLLVHAAKCRDPHCPVPNCHIAKQLLKHHTPCESEDCAICGQPVNKGSSAAAAAGCSSGKRPKEEPVDNNEAPVLKKVKVEAGMNQKCAPGGKGKAVSNGKVMVQPKVEPGEMTGEAHSSTMESSSSGVKLEMETGEPSCLDMVPKSGKTKVPGISLVELFTTEQIKEHITSLRLWTGQSKSKAEKNQAMEHQMSENACRLCAVERLMFDPPPLYCTTCGGRIKRNSVYHTAGTGETKNYYCVPCYNASDMVEFEGQMCPKSKLEKKKNDEELEEAWVQCDRCNLWDHQICGLFNGRRNEGGEADYICPQCLMKEMENGDRKPLPSTSVLVAKDLPRTLLSDHLEQRLARRLKQERSERARVQGKTFEEVPGAEGLVVRVVSSMDKKLEVKQRFQEIFKDSEYPKDYQYKSKVVLLFQRIEGVEVCLFAMYVQEFGAECPEPNNRRLYIAYLDSVKYFRPEVKTVNGEALRTFVYHELLIGYLEYSKRRGFGSCYIWACPPLRGEDYILYCHPEIQKTPKSDKLREWYLTMLGKATRENIVVELTNVYDYFFVSPDECKAHVTAARLPYFDGDYWPGAAEDMLLQLHQEEEERRKSQKKGISKKGVTKRAGVQTEMVSNASKDLQLMHKLGQTILPMKEDFIMVHMHHTCRHCRLFITSGYRWVCRQCKNFQLCNRCYIADQKLDEKDRHPWNNRESHELYSVEVADVSPDTKDKDENMESEFFDTRQAFLSLCQGNHYQNDTLRRAKHSSMMVLYHLHNPTAPAFVASCNLCNQVIESRKSWRCDVCVDYDICEGCFPKELPKHPHKLKPLSGGKSQEQNKEARQQRVLQVRKMMELLVHSACCSAPCNYPKCRNVKHLFRHGTSCKVRVSGGCRQCKMMWHLMQLHARSCQESDCRVPRCKDLKEHVQRSQLQSESRRRAAVMEMIKERSTQVESSSM